MKTDYVFNDTHILYEVPATLKSAYTRQVHRFEGYGPTGVASIYYTAWSRQKFLSEVPIGNLTFALIECPHELQGKLSLENMEDYYRRVRKSETNALEISRINVGANQWVALEEYARSDRGRIRSIAYYRPVGVSAVLFLGLGSVPSGSWPPELMAKLQPALTDMLKSVTVQTASTAR